MASPTASSGWETRLVNYPWPATQPLATFGEQTLVIGIGNFGAKLIEGLYNRLDDVDALKPLGAGIPNSPQFLHLTMPRVDGTLSTGEYGENTYFADIPHNRISLTEEPRTPDATTLHQIQSWDWVTIVGLPPEQLITRRSAARIVLHKDLQFHEASRLYRTLAELDNRASFTRVLIVAGADNPVGAQLLGDVAALIRLLWARGADVEIFALIAASSREQTSTDATATAAAVLEAASITSAIRLSWRFPFGSVWNAENAERQLLNGALLLRTPYPASLQEAEAVIWGLLTSETTITRSLAQEVVSKSGNLPLHLPRGKYLPTISSLYAREVVFPLRFLRELRAINALIALIGQGADIPLHSEGYNLKTGSGITLALEATREAGLISWLNGFAYITQHVVQPLIRVLKEIQRELQQQRDKLIHQLRSFINAASETRIVPQIVEQWIKEPVRGDILRELQSRAGFTVIDEHWLTIWATGEHHKPITFDSTAILRSFVQKEIFSLARDLVMNGSQSELNQLRADYFDDPDNQMEWGGLYEKWSDSLRPFVRGSLPSGVRWDGYSTVELDERSLTMRVDQTKVSTDSTSALQFVLFPRVPLANLTLNVGVNPTLLKSSFVYPMQSIVTDLFGWGENVTVPYNLQAALIFIRAFKRFAMCYANGTLNPQDMSHNGSTFLPFSEMEKKHPWELILWRFIELYEGGRLSSELDEKASQKSSGVLVQVEGSTFADYLKQAVEKVNSPQCPPYYKI